jgi:mono/diheme cytochrome c family protein
MPSSEVLHGDMKRSSQKGHASLAVLVLGGALALAALSAATTSRPISSSPQPVAVTPAEVDEVLQQYCVICHNQRANTAGLALDTLNVEDTGAHPATWEKVVKKLRTGTMPPGGLPRPEAETYVAVAEWLENELDRNWATNPNPGRINAMHRLNRTEYNNAIQDLFGLDLDVRALLPGDETADGSFDNFAAGLSITTAHLERYMSVARTVTRAATGLPPTNPVVETFEVPLHIVQTDLRSTDLPLGSRGGIAVPYNFPAEGEYLIKIRLRRQYQDYIMGMGWPQQFDLRLDGEVVERFTVGGNAPGTPATRSFAGAGNNFGSPDWEEFMHNADDSLEVRLKVEAGRRVVGVAFVRDHFEPEFVPQPLQRGRVLTNDEQYMEHAGIHSVEIGGPYEMSDELPDTPSRQAIFTCHPEEGAEEVQCAEEILSRFVRSAFRRPTQEADVEMAMEFFRLGRENGGSFDTGIQFALERILVDPEFLVRVYRDPPELAPDAEVYPLSDLELASRLSFFIWSSIPDEELLAVAEAGGLSDPEVRRQQVLRMLKDPRATEALVKDFTAQWLNLRLLDEELADPDLYPDFDDNLIEAFRNETQLFVGSTFEEDRSVVELLTADYTFVNERLARHYGIPDVYGSRFRRVQLPNLGQRGGILGHAGLLAATSYPDRTSPVLRGKWLLDNILGAPVAPPPPNVSASLSEEPSVAGLSIRDRLEQHRNDPICSSCHSIMDPLGFALESFDATGRWRVVDELKRPVDNVGTWTNGEEINGFTGLRSMLVDQREQFVQNLTGKLMSYALGRSLEYYDQPAIRRIVRDAEADDYRWSSIISGITETPAFLMRAVDETD